TQTSRRDTGRKARIVIVSFCGLALFSVAGYAQTSPPALPAPNATVKADALTVYSDMRTSSMAINSLKRGDQVIVDFEFKTSAGRWGRVKLPSQKVRLGYVQCTGLDRKEEIPAYASGSARGRSAEVAGRSLANVPVATPPQSARGYEEIA